MYTIHNQNMRCPYVDFVCLIHIRKKACDKCDSFILRQRHQTYACVQFHNLYPLHYVCYIALLYLD